MTKNLEKVIEVEELEAQENKCTGLDCMYCLTLNCPNEVIKLREIIKKQREQYIILYNKIHDPSLNM